jgi:hypothetical protein
MDLIAHVSVIAALTVGCASGLAAGLFLLRLWQPARFSTGPGARSRALGVLSLTAWEILSFLPWLSHAASGTIVLTSSLGLVPLLWAMRFFHISADAAKQPRQTRHRTTSDRR